MIHSFSKVGKLVTFDADDTIYEDGGVVHATSPMRAIITDLMTRGINVSLCTAAGYPGNARRYEERLRGLLDGFLESDLPEETLKRFMVMGGECNYLLRLNKTVAADGTASMGLEFVDEKLWKDGRGVRWNHDDIMSLLDRAEAALRECADALRLKIDILRKERSVGKEIYIR
jgi:IMP and pyridine-specific 5'-nucleotidase